jgi:hypothetical protein
MIPKCTPTLGVAFVQKSQVSIALVEEQINTKWGPHDIIEFFLKCRYLKCPYIVHLNLKCMSTNDQKKGQESNWGFDS